MSKMRLVVCAQLILEHCVEPRAPNLLRPHDMRISAVLRCSGRSSCPKGDCAGLCRGFVYIKSVLFHSLPSYLFKRAPLSLPNESANAPSNRTHAEPGALC
ncbi:hypothetical protein CY34DRAFT_470688 [Suillus luteus UH-Slu-Lm8-n1]|uniref:Uncharacterized protein n=1 Tax=Suillus luteus UH-Slu-Lm8-n1 TaxID=930992 RepID=A0A0D0ASH0_9AGAM|nr:hypothetical protein CY34DRAFT_470688 [Suillus luteus UH-Slu-Lm8-n1]